MILMGLCLVTISEDDNILVLNGQLCLVNISKDGNILVFEWAKKIMWSTSASNATLTPFRF